jgi:hypothetical protein
MDIGIFKTLKDEWPIARVAPWSFMIVLAVGIIFGFGVSTLWWTGTVSALRERVSLYQDRLQGASPDQAAQKIKTLTEQVEALQSKERARAAKEWPPLTPKQIAKWAIRLSKYKPSFLASCILYGR